MIYKQTAFLGCSLWGITASVLIHIAIQEGYWALRLIGFILLALSFLGCVLLVLNKD